MNVRQSLRQGKLTGLCVPCTSKINASNQPKGRKSHKWKGGKFTTSKGYVMFRNPEHPSACNGYVFEHRLVMEKHLGRYLLKHETVHHKNGVRSENRIENLELWTKSHGDGYRYQDMGKRVICKLQRFCVDFGGLEPHSIDAPIPRTHKGMRFPGDDHEKAIAFSYLQYTRERSPFKIRLP